MSNSVLPTDGLVLGFAFNVSTSIRFKIQALTGTYARQEGGQEAKACNDNVPNYFSTSEIGNGS